MLTIDPCKTKNGGQLKQSLKLSRGGLKSEMQHPTMLNTSVDCGLSLFGDPLHEVPEGLEQSIGVLVTAPLPGAVGITEVHAHVRGAVQIAVPRHLFATVVGQRLAHGLSDLVELEGEGRQGRFSGRIGHLGQQHRAGGSLDQNADGGLVPGTLDQVIFPVAGHHTIPEAAGEY
jgi:hypothetical protein